MPLSLHGIDITSHAKVTGFRLASLTTMMLFVAQSLLGDPLRVWLATQDIFLKLQDSLLTARQMPAQCFMRLPLMLGSQWATGRSKRTSLFKSRALRYARLVGIVMAQPEGDNGSTLTGKKEGPISLLVKNCGGQKY